MEPSVLKMVTNSVRILAEGSCSDRYMKGSNLMEQFAQSGQTSVDLSRPCTAVDGDVCASIKLDAIWHGYVAVSVTQV